MKKYLVLFFLLAIFFAIGRMAYAGSDTITNSIGMTFKLIPAGTFTMGSPKDELGRYWNENQHQVTLTKSFYMQTTEVTQGQWEAVMGSNPSYFSNCGFNCPVEQVSWNDAQEFITKLNQQEGTDKYRLPTEAEWEYAARAGSTTAFANGDIAVTGCEFDANLDAIGWYCGNSSVNYEGCYDASGWGGPSCAGTHPVAQKMANAWGLYDVHGNVYEWVQNWYEVYPLDSETDPQGPSSGSYRVKRGGYWNYVAEGSRSADRCPFPPDVSRYSMGFRLAMTKPSLTDGCPAECGPVDTSLSLSPGWNLVGLKSNQTTSITDLLTLTGNESSIISVWKWDNSNSKWYVYLSKDAGLEITQEYVNNKGFWLLENINPGEGFWVNSTEAITLD